MDEVRAEFIVNTPEKCVVLDKDGEQAIVKGLRLLLLVGNDRDTRAAASLLDLLLAGKT